PIEFAAGFLDAAAIAVISVSNASTGLHLAFGVPGVGVDAVVGSVAGSVVAEAGEVVADVRRLREPAFLCAAGVVRVCGGGDGLQIGPRIGGVGLAPAVSGAGGEGRSGLRAGDAIELIVSEGLRASGVEIVGDAVDVAGVVVGHGIDEVVRDVD